MSAEYFCQEHGPYLSNDGQCPYCSRSARPPAPPPLGMNEDDMPTNLGGNPWSIPVASAPINAGFRSVDDVPTSIPGPVRSNGPAWSPEDEEETRAPRSRRYIEELDQTELGEELVQEGLLGLLWVKSGRLRGKVFPLRDGTVIGRKDSDPVNLVLDDPKLSQPHAKFAIRNNQFVVADMLSKNGTIVNGNRIEAITPLEENDTIQMGSTVFILKTIS